MITEGFSFSRFGKVMRKYVAENGRLMLLGTAMVFGVMIIGDGLIAYLFSSVYYDDFTNHREIAGIIIDPAWRNSYDFMTFMLFILGSVFASMTGSGLSSKEKRLSFTMLPASALEKYLVRWLIYIPGFVVVFIAAFYVGELVRVAVTSGLVDDTREVSVINIEYMFKNLYSGEINTNNILIYMIFFGVQALFSLGGFLWPKASLVKTFVAGAIMVLCFVLSVVGVTSLLLKPEYSLYFLEKSTTEAIFYVSSVVVALFCYILSYFRTKEMEIINRW